MGFLLLLCIFVSINASISAESSLSNDSNDVASNDVPEWKKWCSNHDCPHYEVLKVYDGFEERKYPLYKWVTANQKKFSMFWADNYNFMKLFKYIRGHNSEKIQVPMTVPVCNRIVEKDERTFEKDYTMMFWLPQQFQSKPPAPVDGDQVSIVEWSERTVYVASYGGWASERKIRSNANKLRESLEKAGLDYDNSYIYSQSYQAPFQIWKRHNEVMFAKEN